MLTPSKKQKLRSHRKEGKDRIILKKEQLINLPKEVEDLHVLINFV